MRQSSSDDPDRPTESKSLLEAYAESVSELETFWTTSGKEATEATLSGKPPRFETPPSLTLGTEVNGRYRIEAVLGAGGMGRVYRVQDSLYPDRPTALKTVVDVDDEKASLFRTEFRTMASLGHPGVARVYDFERIVGRDEFFFTMELVDGKDIASVTDAGDWKRTTGMLVQVALALDYIHRRGVIHLDLKPGNVLVTVDAANRAHVKVLDFGLVGMQQTHSLFGTLMYIAPELIRGMVPDARADIYALGVMAFELLCGRRPYDATSNPTTLLNDKRTRPVVFPADADVGPRWLRDAVERMCKIDPAERFPDAMELARELADGVDGPGTLDMVSPPISKSQFVGRERELRATIEHVRSSVDLGNRVAGAQFLFVSGSTGIGKSRLVHEARHRLQVDNVVFLSGDAFAADLAEYTPIVPVLLAAASLALANDADDLIAEHGAEIVKLAPGFGQSRGVSASAPLENATAERRRIHQAAADFLLALSSRVGFAVCFNDLQWASRGSVDLLLLLVSRMVEFPDSRLALLGTHRSDDIDDTPFESLLNTGHRNLPLDPIDADEAGSLIQSMLGGGVSDELVERLHRATGGQPFLLEAAVRNFVASGGIVFRQGRLELSTGLEKELSGAIAASDAVLSGVSLLDDVDHKLMALMAACGRPVPVRILANAAEMERDAVHVRLRSLTERQFVLLLAGADSRYGLAHDSLRAAVYDACNDAERQLLHQKLADAYAKTLSPEDAGEHLLSTAAQLLAAGSTEHEAEGIARAAIAIRAARAAYGATAFSQALTYLDAASNWLPESKWERCRQLALDLEEQRAYACIAEERLDEAEASALRVERYASDVVSSARGRRIWTTCQFRRGNISTVIESGIGLVRRLGERFPRRPNMLHAIAAMVRVRRRFKPAFLRRLETLPTMTDPRAIEIDKCLEAMSLAAYLEKPTLLPVIYDAGSRLIMSHGLSPSASVTVLGSGLLMAALGDVPKMLEMGDAGMTLLPRTHRSSHGMARYTYTCSMRPFRDSLHAIGQDLVAIRDECLEMGDNMFAGMACISRMAIDVSAGAPLPDTKAFMEDPVTRQVVESSALTKRSYNNIRQARHHLRNGADGPLFEGPYSYRSDTKDLFQRSSHAYYLLMVEATYRRQASPDVRGLRIPLTIERIWAGQTFVPETYLNWALCALTACRSETRTWRRWSLHYGIKRMRRQLGKWVARHPANHQHRATLLEAEWQRYRGRSTNALTLYEQAIREADEAKDLRTAGLARELRAEAHLERGDREQARSSLEAARACYEQWGSPGKVRDLERRYADLFV